MRRSVALLFAVLVYTLGAAPADAMVRQIDAPVRGSTLAARGQVLAYSFYDEASASYRLRIKVGSTAPRTLGVAARSIPFDAGVGQMTTAAGRGADVVVYSRCAKEPWELGFVTISLNWAAARRCGLYTSTLAGREQRIGRAGEGVLPSVAGTRIAYARVPAWNRASIIIRRTDRRGPPLRTFAAPTIIGLRALPVSLSLYAGRVAVVWRVDTGEGDESRLEVLDVGSGRRTWVSRVAGGGMTGVEISGPTWLGDGSLQWLEACGGDPSGCPHRHNYARLSPGGRVSRAPSPKAAIMYTTTAHMTWTLRGCSTTPSTIDPLAPNTCRLLEESPAPLVPLTG